MDSAEILGLTRSRTAVPVLAWYLASTATLRGLKHWAFPGNAPIPPLRPCDGALSALTYIYDGNTRSLDAEKMKTRGILKDDYTDLFRFRDEKIAEIRKKITSGERTWFENRLEKERKKEGSP